MVNGKAKAIFLFLMCLFAKAACSDAVPKIEVTLDATVNPSGEPLKGTIVLAKNAEDKSDNRFFLQSGKPFEVVFEREVATGNLLLSFYRFVLPAEKSGLHLLPSISVKVNGKVYSSVPGTFQVEDTDRPLSAHSARSGISGGKDETRGERINAPVFRLEAEIKGPSVLYPGQRAEFVYRIIFNRDIDLTRSEFPLIDAAGFKKVGDVRMTETVKSGLTVQQLLQEVEASDVGIFRFARSLVEGRIYATIGNEKRYDPDILHAEAPPFQLEVKPFPASGRPLSFMNALGKLEVKAHLSSPSEIPEGENVKLDITVSGISDLSELKLPSLSCQPGFLGFFRFDDLPPLTEIEDGKKIFHLEMRPLTYLIDRIPSIELSSFDPGENKYVVRHTEPVPLKVTPLDGHRNSDEVYPFVALAAEKIAPPSSPNEIRDPPVSPVTGDPILISRLEKSGVSFPFGFLSIPAGIFLLIFQYFLRKRLLSKSRIRKLSSEALFEKALEEKRNPVKCARLLEMAIWNRFWEQSQLPEGEQNPDKIPFDEKSKRVRLFLIRLQAIQYGKDRDFDPEKICDEGKNFLADDDRPGKK